MGQMDDEFYSGVNDAKANKEAAERNGRIIVRNISFKATNKALKEHFEEYGTVQEVSLLKKPDGKLVGCGFVHFADVAMAEKAIAATNKKPFLGPAVPLSVDGVTEPGEIADKFRRHFSVTSRRVEEQIPVAGDIMSGGPIHISTKEIRNIIRSMNRGKSPGHDGLSIEHLQYAGPHLPRVLSMLFNFCVRHSYLPKELMRTIVMPIAKNKTGDASDKDNYREKPAIKSMQ